MVIVDYIKERLIGFSVRHIYGLKKVNLLNKEVIVLCLVKNGEEYMKSFINHYFRLGVKHIVFLDNGSLDNTVRLAIKYGRERVTVLQTNYPFKKNNNMRMRAYLVDRFAKNKWSLCVDIDEFFDYPESGTVSLKELIGYLNENKYTAVLGQMLDMFPENLVKGRGKNFDRRDHKYYEISNIKKIDYYFCKDAKKKLKGKLKFHLGGIRKTVFNANSFLSKHSLFFNNSKTKMSSFGHVLDYGRVADFSVVLFHYKFTDNFFKRVKDAVKREQYYKNSKEYKSYYKVLQSSELVDFKDSDFNNFKNIKELVDNGFLVVSNRYNNYVYKIRRNNEDIDVRDFNFEESDLEKKEDVGVIIGVRNRLDYRLENAFKSIRNQDYSQELIKMILVDYGSKKSLIDGYKKLCKKYNVEYLRVEGVDIWNRSHALNIGIKRAETKYVLCSDVDIIFKKNYISECVKEMQKDIYQVLYCTMMHLVSENSVLEFDVIENYSVLKKRAVFQRVVENYYNYIYGRSINFTLRKFYFEVNGYDEYYSAWGWEDDDIIKRFEKKGLRYKCMDFKTSHLHQWHPRLEGLSEEDKKYIEKNRKYFENIEGIIRNKNGWGEYEF